MSFFQSINSRTMRTFRHKSSGNNQNRGSVAHYRLRQYAEATLGSGSLKAAVRLPEGEEVTEWVAVHTVDFYNQLNMLYSSITEFCSPTTCPEMKATDEYEYLWQDNDKYKKPTKLPAPEYIENLMIWIQSLFDNEAIFPTKVGVPFPRNFLSTIKTVFKRLYRIYAHIYCHHFEIITELGLQPHLNTSFKHFVLFAKEFDLISPKDYGPLADLSEIMIQDDTPKDSE